MPSLSRLETAVLLTAIALLLPAQGLAARTDLRGLLERASSSVVRVESALSLETARQCGASATGTYSNCGFFVDTEGHVLTSLLGVAGCDRISVACADGRRTQARVMAVDQPANLALLKTELEDTVPFEPVQEAPEKGELVVLAGLRHHGDGLHGGVLPGMVISTRGSVRFQGIGWYDLPVLSLSPPTGEAAGPLLTMDGRLAGITLGVRTGSSGPARMGGDSACVALPTAQLQPILDRLLRGESRQLGWLGVMLVRRPGDQEGVPVNAVMDGSPAQRAGIRPGDVLLQIGSEPLRDVDALARSVAAGGPRRDVEVSLLRSGNVRTISVDIEPRPLLMWAAEREAKASTRRTPETPAQLRRENRQLREHIRRLQQQLRDLQNQMQ